ncbi:MAG: excinuclease ABC subunit UvrC [Thermoplasmata archaeon]
MLEDKKLQAIKVQALPEEPGIYLFKDKDGNVIYIGKAKNIKKRVIGHIFHDPKGSPKDSAMFEKVSNVDFIITHSPSEALLLESHLIKKYRPKYNIVMKDDKSYPYIKLSNVDFPYVSLTRRLGDVHARYFGPYSDVASARFSINQLTKLFGIRTCRTEIDENTKKKPCLNYHIRRCSAPCAGEISKKEYMQQVRRLCNFLDGKRKNVINEMKKEMEECSNRLEFERAKVIRDALFAFGKLDDQQSIFTNEDEFDVLALERDSDDACVQVMHYRNGKLSGNEHFMLVGCESSSENEIGLSFIKQYYTTKAVPQSIVLGFELPKEEIYEIESFLKEKNEDFKFLNPEEKENLIKLAKKNAKFNLDMKKIEERYRKEKFSTNALKELQYALLLDKLPMRIECFDVSNLGDMFAVASLVVFEGGLAKKKDYRKFKIRKEGQNDLEMIAEAVNRRYSRLLSENAKLPDLIIVDGGKNHVEFAARELDKLCLSIPLVGLAKQHEYIYQRERSEPIILKENSAALFLVQRIRDEAHRFAQSYHKKLRELALEESQLSNVKGIGEKRKKALLSKFGSLESIKDANIDEVAKVNGMTKKLAKKLIDEISK